jgi:hypothetical protein
MRVASFLWKGAVVAVAFVAGAFAANQAGWSGADLVVNAPIMETAEDLITGVTFGASFSVIVGTVFLIYRLAKHVLWVAGPILLYVALVPGVWHGVQSDFDVTRGAVLLEGRANAYAIEHMTERGRYRSCNDDRIQLTDDAKAACKRALDVGPGEPIPGSEHKCGLLGQYVCVYTAPEEE